MDKSSRTYKSLKNSGVALILFFINLILQFFSRKVFLDYLGTEILGLNTAATSLLQFLNLAELGVGAAITCTLYKPLAEEDTRTINEIVSLQGWLYSRIAIIVIISSAILMAFFPLIFQKMELPIWYAYASFAILLFSSLLSYFANYKQIVLSANQQEYKVHYSYRLVLLIKVIAQIIAIKSVKDGYVAWLALEVLFAIIASISLNYVIKKNCPFLETSINDGKKYKQKYPVVITKIKQFFFHKIAIFVLQQTSPLIIYGFASLTLVAIYGNYLLIVNGIFSLLNAMFNGLMASVGNLVAQGDKERIMLVFRELFSTRFLLATTCCIGVCFVSGPFISLWVGADYILDNTSLLLIVCILYLNTIRSVVDSFINAYGLFKDIFAPVLEAFLNVGLSILLGYYFGLPGILGGVFISLFVIIFIWKPYFLFKNALQVPIKQYIALYAKHICLFSICSSFVFVIYKSIPLTKYSIINQLMVSVLLVFLYSICLFFTSFLFEKGMQNFVNRFIRR